MKLREGLWPFKQQHKHGLGPSSPGEHSARLGSRIQPRVHKGQVRELRREFENIPNGLQPTPRIPQTHPKASKAFNGISKTRKLASSSTQIKPRKIGQITTENLRPKQNKTHKSNTKKKHQNKLQSAPSNSHHDAIQVHDSSLRTRAGAITALLAYYTSSQVDTLLGATHGEHAGHADAGRHRGRAAGLPDGLGPGHQPTKSPRRWWRTVRATPSHK